MRKYLLWFVVAASPLAAAHQDGSRADAVPAVPGALDTVHKSTSDVAYEFADIEGGGSYGAIRLAFAKTDAVGMVGKYWSSKGVQFTRHTHTDWVVVTVITGKVEVVRQDGADVRVYLPGDTYLVEPGETHMETSLEDTEVVVVNGPRVNREQFVMRTVSVPPGGN